KATAERATSAPRKRQKEGRPPQQPDTTPARAFPIIRGRERPERCRPGPSPARPIAKGRSSSWFQETHRFNGRHNAIEEQLRIKSRGESGEDKETRPPFFRGGNCRLLVPVGICWDPAFLDAHVAEESFFQGPQSERGDEHHACTSDEDGHRERFPRAEKDCNFRGKTAEPRNPHRRGGSDNERKRGE